ncbi:DEKNAAC105597 [Brettanomyces naardenensis]|uniref:DEKNAAC105597 n=1 Tax=Brettanomyces naardenensis TaxID=13370 RepID=A0A448YU08_BRENA|nr:DEKNAAC105597 [Brettanomyces naardenensis]
MVVPTDIDGKRRKLESDSSSSSIPVRYSRIFSPFRTIGHVSDGTPFAIGTLGQTFYIATVVGRSFQIYDAATLHLLFVSHTQTPVPITSIEAHFQYVFCSYGNKIGVFRRGRLEHEFAIPGTDDDIVKLLVFGNYIVAATTSALHIFEKRSSKSAFATEFYASVPINSLYGTIVDISHLPTQINKVVVATSSTLLVVNVRSTKLIYATDSELFSGITCIEPTPALDVIAVGDDTGRFVVYNVRKNRILQKISTGSNAPVTSISFRTDGTPHAVCSLRSGELFFYDLARKSRVHILRNAHKEAYGGATKAVFLNGQPIVVSTGPDNSLKEFVFDPVLSTTNSAIITPPRHLRSRGGHSAPPTCLLFADNKSHYLQSASQDRSFWTFSLRKDAQSQEMSQKQSREKNGKRVAGVVSQYRDKFPPITMMAQENAREGEWDNIVTAHQEETFARTWDSRNRKVGKYELATIDGGVVKAVAMTQCGNFALIGSSKGGIGVYNVQSGKLRKMYRLHKKAVTGVAVDGMNRKMVSCGLDGIVGFYDFSMSHYLGKLQLDSPITQLVYHRSSDLVALALDDMSIVVIDASTQRIVRQLFGHRNRITALDFSADGRWLVSASLDSTIRTWDLPTGSCIDGIKLDSIATCLKISPQGDYMATAHVNGLGVSLWTNKAQFHPVSTRNIEEESEFANITLPNVSGDGGATILEGAFEENEEPDRTSAVAGYVSPLQLDDSLVTLSHCSTSKFSTLYHLDTIRRRNKPADPVEKPESVPFFMQISGDAVGDRARTAEEGGAANVEQKAEQSESSSRLLSLNDRNSHQFESEFTRLLRTAGQSGEPDYGSFIGFLVDLSPANTDLEVRSLSTVAPFNELVWFLGALKYGFQENRNFELLTAIMAILLRVHGDVIYDLKQKAANKSEENYSEAIRVIEALNACADVSLAENSKVDELVKYCSSVMNLVTTA